MTTRLVCFGCGGERKEGELHKPACPRDGVVTKSNVVLSFAAVENLVKKKARLRSPEGSVEDQEKSKSFGTENEKVEDE